MKRMAMSSVVILILGAAACGGSEPSPKAPEPPPASSPSTNAPATGATTTTGTEQTTRPEGSLASSNMGLGSSPTSNTAGENRASASSNAYGTSTTTDSSGASSPSGSNTATTLSDDQILYVLHAANLGEMEQARIAQKKAQNARVKRFASMMLKDHGEADAHGTDVAKKTQASLAPSDVSNRLESDAKQTTASISAEKGGKDFDRTYIDAQVKEHRAVLDAIDRELLPACKSAEVKELVQTVRPKIEGHLHEAEDIQKGLASK